MLVCTMAANAPSAIEAIETNTRICCQDDSRSPNGPAVTRTNSARAATFGATANSAVTGVGAPS